MKKLTFVLLFVLAITQIFGQNDPQYRRVRTDSLAARQDTLWLTDKSGGLCYVVITDTTISTENLITKSVEIDTTLDQYFRFEGYPKLTRLDTLNNAVRMNFGDEVFEISGGTGNTYTNGLELIGSSGGLGGTMTEIVTTIDLNDNILKFNGGPANLGSIDIGFGNELDNFSVYSKRALFDINEDMRYNITNRLYLNSFNLSIDTTELYYQNPSGNNYVNWDINEYSINPFMEYYIQNTLGDYISYLHSPSQGYSIQSGNSDGDAKLIVRNRTGNTPNIELSTDNGVYEAELYVDTRIGSQYMRLGLWPDGNISERDGLYIDLDSVSLFIDETAKLTAFEDSVNIYPQLNTGIINFRAVTTEAAQIAFDSVSKSIAIHSSYLPVDSSVTTSLTLADTWYFIEGNFVNEIPNAGNLFAYDGDTLQYTGNDTIYLRITIDYEITSSKAATISVGVLNGSGVYQNSIRGESYSVNETKTMSRKDFIIPVNPGDKLKPVVMSSAAATNITVSSFGSSGRYFKEEFKKGL